MKKLQKKSSFFALQSADEAVPDMQVMRRPGSGINTADITSGSSSNNDSNSSSSSSAISTNPAASSPSVARVKTLRRMQSKYNTLSSKDKPPPKEAAPVIPWNGGIYRGAATETINEKGVKISVPNGYGELTFPDGSVFEGIFEDGKRQNHGTLRFVGGSYIFGMWKDDKPDDSSLWKVIYPNGDEFWGTVTILKKDTHITNVNTLKKKEGEIHYHKSREKFFGTWKIDKHTGDTLRDGYGILSNSKGEKYYGEWKKDLFDGQGILFYRDGSYFVGKFSKGKRDGPGTMYFPNGDSIEGLWSDNSVNKATFRKGTPQDISMVSLSLAMQSVKEGLRSRRYQEITTTTASQFKWKLHINLHSKDWEDLQKRLAAWDVDPDSETSIQNSFSAALKEPCVASFLSLFKNSFHGAYFNSQNSTTHDLTHAKDDVDSFTRVLTDRLAECLRLTRRSSKDQLLFIASNYIQSLVYKTLFMLYKKEYDNEDFLLNQRLKELKNVTLSNMGVDIKFQPLSSSSPGHMSIAGISGLGGSHGSVSLHKKLSAGASMTDSPYSAAVREFVSIQWKETAHAKLEAISRMRDLIIQEMLEYRHQRGIMKEWQCSLDEICPVYTYVFIKSHDKLTDLKAQFQYIQDFKDSKQIELDPVNSTLAYFEGFFDFAFQIDSSFQDENGIVVPPNLLCEQLESIVNEQIRGFVSRKQPRPSFMWLPALLLQIGLDISENRLAEDDNCLVLNEELQEELENFIDLANAVLSKSQLGFRIIRSNHDSASSSTSSVGPSSASSSISSPPAVATPRSASFLTSTPALDNNARLHSKSMSFSSSSGGGVNSGVRHPIAFTPRTEAILLGAKSLDGTPAPQLTEEEMAILNNINNPQLLASAIATSTKRRSGQGNNRPTSAPAPVVSTTGEAADVVSSSLSINDIDSETTNNKNDDNSNNNNNNSNSNDNSNSNSNNNNNSNNNSTTPSSPNNEENNNNNNNSNNNTASSSDKGGDVADDSTTVDVDGVELDDDYDDLILVHFERKFAPHIYFKISHHMTKFLNEM